MYDARWWMGWDGEDCFSGSSSLLGARCHIMVSIESSLVWWWSLVSVPSWWLGMLCVKGDRGGGGAGWCSWGEHRLGNSNIYEHKNMRHTNGSNYILCRTIYRSDGGICWRWFNVFDRRVPWISAFNNDRCFYVSFSIRPRSYIL